MGKKKLEEKYAEAIMFQDVIIEELNFKSVGEFVELVGGLMGMLNVNDIDNAKKISEAFALRIGHILDRIGHVDKIIAKNKSMRDFWEEQKRKEEEAKKKKDKDDYDPTKIDESPVYEQDSNAEKPTITFEINDELKSTLDAIKETPKKKRGRPAKSAIKTIDMGE